jgi:hypothetical protein
MWKLILGYGIKLGKNRRQTQLKMKKIVQPMRRHRSMPNVILHTKNAKKLHELVNSHLKMKLPNTIDSLFSSPQ